MTKASEERARLTRLVAAHSRSAEAAKLRILQAQVDLEEAQSRSVRASAQLERLMGEE